MLNMNTMLNILSDQLGYKSSYKLYDKQIWQLTTTLHLELYNELHEILKDHLEYQLGRALYDKLFCD